MKTLYLDVFSGISGDMFLGAMLDLGVDFDALRQELAKLPVGDYHLHADRQTKSGIAGVRFNVHLESDHDHGHSHSHAHPHDHGHSHGHGSHAHDESRDFQQIQKLIEDSPLSTWVKEKAIAVFRRVAVAEGKIHGQPPERVHFHEVGAVDSIVDIVGAAIALDRLGRPRVEASAVVDGTGWVKCAHGLLPVPAPATLEILGARGIPVTQCDERNELVTPTGAALLAEFAERFGPMRDLRVERIGYGLGERDNKTRPNLLRACLAEPAAASPAALDWETDTVAVLETNLDDLSPEILGHFVDATLAAGALDVFHTPIQMKKNRPGVLLTVLCAAADADAFTERLLRETSAFGVRRTLAERRKLAREFTIVETSHGPVTVKLGRLNGQVVQAAPEFESCRKLAEQTGAPLKAIYEAAVRTGKAGA